MVEPTQLLLVVSGLIPGCLTFWAPRAMMKANGPFSRRASQFWITQLGGQPMLFLTRFGGMAVTVWAVLALVAWTGFSVPTPVAVICVVVIGVGAALWRSYHTEWITSFAREVGESTDERIRLLLSVITPGSPLPGPAYLPAEPPQYCAPSSMDPSNYTGDGSFDGGPVGLGTDAAAFQFFTTAAGQLAQITLSGDIWVEIRDSESASTDWSVVGGESSEQRRLSAVSLGQDGRERLASECYQSLARRYSTGLPTSLHDGHKQSFSIELAEPISLVDGDGRVCEVSLEKFTVLLRGPPTNASALSGATYHPELLNDPV